MNPLLGRCEQVAYICFLSFFIMKNRINFDKDCLVQHINGLALEIEELTKPIFHLSFNGGDHINKTGTEGLNLFGEVSSSS